MPPKADPTAAIETLKEELGQLRAQLVGQAAKAAEESTKLQGLVEKLMQENVALKDALGKLKSEVTRPASQAIDLNGALGTAGDNSITSVNNNITLGESGASDRNSVVPNSGSNNDALVSGILAHFQGMPVSVTTPTSDGEKGNALQFLEKLEKYFIRKNIIESQKILIVEEALGGKAKMWLEA